ncbi:sugar ABC transporter ATP-binding protein [Patulibacter sp. S7RM1-6]
MSEPRQAQTGGAPRTAGAEVLRVSGLVKRFAGVPALGGVDLQVRAGEVHGLLGANGCGKSTLIKTLAGVHDADEGQVAIHGQKVPMPFGADGLRDRGLSFVHQDLGLSDAATVLEHLAFDHVAARGTMRRIPWDAERRRAAELLARFEVAVDPDARIDQLTPVQRAMVAIVRAVASQEQHAEGGERRPQLLILDEPTVFLPSADVAILFRLVDRLRQAGDAVILVSHDLDEVLEICDRVTVLRDGRNVGTRDVPGLGRDELVELILGVKIGAVTRPEDGTERSPEVVLSTRGLSGERVRGLDLELHPGEVVGVTGLAGSGIEELTDLLYGVRAPTGGVVRVGGDDVAHPTPQRMLAHDVVLLPADRKGLGSAPRLSVLENMALPFLPGAYRGGRLRWGALRQQAQDTCVRLHVKPADPTALFSSLSGGNQQKALLGKWLDTRPAVMLLAEPTQGVDVGARREIFRLVREAVAGGASVLCATSDYEQLVQLADRVLIFADGRVVDEIAGDAITKDALTTAIYAGVAA